MATSSAELKSALPSVRIMGFSGHRQIQNAAAVANALRTELAELQKTGDQWIAMSSVAIGADMIFAEEVIKAGIKWIVILPMARNLFKDDFEPEQWKRAEELIKLAAEVRSLDGTERPEVYVDCGKRIVDDSDCLIAVWDGKPARGPGGTAENVGYAKMLDREIIVFCEDGGSVKKTDTSSVAEFDFKPEHVLGRMGPKPTLPPPPPSLVEYFKDCDARGLAPDEMQWKEFFHLAATLVAVFSLALHAHHLDYVVSTIVFAVLKVAFVFGVAWLSLSLGRAFKRFEKRLAAEYCRSVIATWNCRYFIEPDPYHDVPELRELSRAVLYLHLKEEPRAPTNFEPFRAAYANDRVMDQWTYFRKWEEKAEVKAHHSRKSHITYTVAAVVFSVILLVILIFDPEFSTDNFDGWPWPIRIFLVLFDVFPLALPAVASYVIAIRAIGEADRRTERFRELQIKMYYALVDLSNCTSWEGLRHVVEKTERNLFHEVQEWYSISKYSAKE